MVGVWWGKAWGVSHGGTASQLQQPGLCPLQASSGTVCPGQDAEPPTPEGCPHFPPLLNPTPSPPPKLSWVKPPLLPFSAHSMASFLFLRHPLPLPSALATPTAQGSTGAPTSPAGTDLPSTAALATHGLAAAPALLSLDGTPAHFRFPSFTSRPRQFTYHVCSTLGAPPGGQGFVLLSTDPRGPDVRTWDPVSAQEDLREVPGHAEAG